MKKLHSDYLRYPFFEQENEENQAYLDGMNKVLEKENLRLSKSELRELLYGFNGSDEELLQKPLSKLARDLISNLKK